MFRASDLIAVTCLFLAAETTAGQILPPQNLSLLWLNDFEVEISWDPPPHSVAGCKYQIEVNTTELERKTSEPPDTSYKRNVWMDGRFLGYSLITDCGVNKSEPAKLNITYPELVKALDCYVINSTQGHCSWSPVCDATDLRFSIVKPPPLKWEVKKSKDNFSINWSPPDMLDLDSWKFRLNYTFCGREKNDTFERVTSHKLDRASHCRYCLSIEAMSIRGNSPPTDKECFDADQDLSFLVYVVIFVIISLAAIAFVCFQRNKENIFPKVPVPRDFLSDISNNNNQSPFRKLYIQAEEEENCKVTLVTNTQTNKPDC